MYSIFYYNIINIRVLLIIGVLVILKHFGDLDFEYYIYMCVCVERERGKREGAKFLQFGDFCIYIYIYIYIYRERERERERERI